MSLFTPSEFRKLYGLKHEHISTTWNVGRGQWSKHKPMDMLFMTLVVMKYGRAWDQSAQIFKITGPTFMRIDTKFTEKTSAYAEKRFISTVSKVSSMTALREECIFKHYPYALGVLDVTFQQNNRPAGHMAECKCISQENSSCMTSRWKLVSDRTG